MQGMRKHLTLFSLEQLNVKTPCEQLRITLFAKSSQMPGYEVPKSFPIYCKALFSEAPFTALLRRSQCTLLDTLVHVL